MKIDTNMTREQFLRARTTSVWCPSYFNINSTINSNNCEGKTTCYECWSSAVKDLKFKGE